jgi:molecular chaperone GrpE
VTDAQQGADPAVEADEPDRSTAPEPDTNAQQGADPEGEAASQPEAAPEAEAEEAAGEAQETEAGEAQETEAGEAQETEDEDEADEQVVTERADEEPEAAEPEEPAADDAELVAAVTAARAEAESYLDDLRRLQAEFDNYRKRMLREQTARIASASQALVARLLPVLDNFELAVSHAEQSRDFDRMLKGVEMVFGELREVLQAEGLVKIEAEGKPFDPERHEAVVAVEQEDAEPGTVVDVVRTGYELRGKVLRPAMVKVAK